MSRATSVRLNEHFAEFVEQQTSSGRYASSEDVVEAGLRLLEANERKLEALRQAIAEGDASGFANDFRFSHLYDRIDELAATATASR